MPKGTRRLRGASKKRRPATAVRAKRSRIGAKKRVPKKASPRSRLRTVKAKAKRELANPKVKVYVVTSAGVRVASSHARPASSAAGLVNALGMSDARYRRITSRISTLLKAGKLRGLKW
jgi:hypothetical protein